MTEHLIGLLGAHVLICPYCCFLTSCDFVSVFTTIVRGFGFEVFVAMFGGFQNIPVAFYI